MKQPDFEIGDSIVFAKPSQYSSDLRNWKAGRITDIAGELIEIESRCLLGFYRRKWIQPGIAHYEWKVRRKDRADEMIARYQSKP